ncbi:asparagine synthase (glutamine-hydrolyzing) [Aliarcobacter butzleri]|uniref:asparagine synthase (glutamine-hydrolyzing) n=1 Tax=Aliarcobacter butzleri TaxID=28197 RepID=UPI00125EB783|nr:asparagine synthase (glutamine-hydrolyzing) [Aliarcobacter butzleri]MCG3713217.1 asparagine synthase (glutamine-hydrolyzing) [Aliarcobacter butzleri]
MCGIAGFCDFSKKLSKNDLELMTDVLHHRGPDDSGYRLFEDDKYSIGLGHRRLSILDLSTHGHQPMHFENIEIVFNGEVYNFKEIKDELLKYGYTFFSDSDTEVILKAYHKWGIQAINKFNGMFSIIIYDIKINKLIFIRDRAGIKPLYYYWNKETILFSSELKSFHKVASFIRELNKNSIALYFQYGYIPQPHTIFENTYKLESGYYLTLDLNTKELHKTKYWDVIDCYNKEKVNVSEEEAIKETEELLKSACEYRMISDVPVGVFLSGGYDSSLVASLLQKDRTEKIRTFTIGFHENKFNEAPFAKKIADYLGTNHTEYYCTAKDAIDILPLLPEIYDEPFSDNSSIPTILVSKIARKDVTVSLSADGGDELFGGYDKYIQVEKLNSYISKIPFKSAIGKLMTSIDPSKIPFTKNINKFDHRYSKISQSINSKNPIEIMSLITNLFTPIEVKNLLSIDFVNQTTSFDDIKFLRKDLTIIDKMLAIDYKTFQLDDILTKVDRATMSVSLEGREPLLDYRLIEYVSRLNSNLKIKNGNKKYLLKEITHKYIPKEMMDRPKMGFSTPIIGWFQKELKDYLVDYFNEDFLKEQKIFNIKVVQNLRDDYLAGKIDNIHKIWALIVFQLWYFKWLK